MVKGINTIWYGNGTKTSYAYEAATFRLKRLLTVNLSTNDMVQDLRYWYDPVGNITRIGDEAQQTLFYANQLVSPEQDFTYDALYRLVEASGREQISSAAMGIADNWDDRSYKAPLGGDAAQNYSRRYTYDAVGNVLELKHVAGVGSYTRSYGYGTSNNRLVTTEIDGTVYTYGHDARGNITAMPHLDAGWGLQSQMIDALVGGVRTFYQYDSGGERERKYTDKGSVKEERIYLGSYEVYREYDGSGNLTLERTTVHVSDDTGRIAMLENRTVGTDPSPASLTRYIYSNHLQSATLELDDSGQVISYEEYHPYGTTAYQAMNAAINAVAKRYRFSGKERDEESGLYYYGARYYAPWLGRWTAVDPINSDWYNLEKGYGLEKNAERSYLELTASSYEYCYDNPIVFNDRNGEQPNAHKITIANLHRVNTINNAQMMDALRLARDEVAVRLQQHKPFAIGGENSIKSLGRRILGYAQSHQLSARQTAEFHQTANQYYIGLTVVAQNSTRGFERMNLLVINNAHISNEAKLTTAIKGMIESHVNLASFMGIAANVAMLPATEGLFPNVGKGLVGPRISSETQQEIVTLGIARGIKIVEQHLATFSEATPGNVIMVQRLKAISSGKLQPTQIDIDFYRHETREASLMKTGMTYEDAHFQTLREQGIDPKLAEKRLYTKEAIEADYKYWDKQARTK